MSLYYLCPHCTAYQSIVDGTTCFCCKKDVTRRYTANKATRKPKPNKKKGVKK